MQRHPRDILVLGLGTVLGADAGFGGRCVERLADWGVAPMVGGGAAADRADPAIRGDACDPGRPAAEAAREGLEDEAARTIAAAPKGLPAVTAGGEAGDASADREGRAPTLPRRLQAAPDAGRSTG